MQLIKVLGLEVEMEPGKSLCNGVWAGLTLRCGAVGLGSPEDGVY